MFAVWSSHELTLVKLQKNSPSSPEARSVEDEPTLQAEQGDRRHPGAEDPGQEHQAEELAYVLHTSGTTGRPKIVKVPHKCIVPNIVHLR